MQQTLKATPKHNHHLIGLMLCAIVAVAFSGVLRCQFVNWDDGPNVYLNPSYHPVSAESVADLWRRPQLAMYIPVTRTVWAGLVALAHLPRPIDIVGVGLTNLSPLPFHAVSLLLHVCNVWLVFCILSGLVGDDRSAALGALLFGLHPMQVETVAWIAEMKGLLCATFSLLALCLIQSYVSPSTEQGRARTYLWFAGGCYMLALLSKPSAVTLPLVALALLWLDCAVLPDLDRARARLAQVVVACGLPIAALMVLLTRQVQPVTAKAAVPLLVRPLVSGDALAFYLAKLALPLHLAADYGRTPQWVLAHHWAHWTWLLPVGAAIAIAMVYRTRPWLAAGALIMSVAVAPVLGLLPFVYQAFSTVADRYVYLGMLGPAAVMACVMARHRSSMALLGAGCYLGVLGLLSFAQVGVWHDSEMLFSHALAITPSSWLAHNNLGIALQSRGRLNEAIGQYRATMALKADFPEAPYNCATALLAQGDRNDAIPLLGRAIAIDPLYAEPRLQLGLLLLARGNDSAALPNLRRAAELAPFDWESRAALGELLNRQGQWAAAADALDRSVQLNPEVAATHYQFGVALNRLNYGARAQSEFAQALRLEPNYPEALSALGALLAGSGNLTQAQVLLRRALALKPSDVGARYNLGGVLLLAGNKQQAAAQWQQVLKLRPGYAPAARALEKLGSGNKPARDQ